MRPRRHRLAPLALVFALLACVAPERERAPASREEPGRIDLAPIAPHVWVHTSWNVAPGFEPFPSNGLVVEGPEGVVLVDTAPTPEATAALVDWVAAETAKPVVAVIVTHAHDDRMGGLAIAHARGAVSYATALTAQDARARGLGEIERTIAPAGQTLMLAGVRLDAYFPGAGHTRDNLVVFLPESGVLFGGCLVRAASAGGMGNTADASLASWAASAEAVGARFPDAAHVVPGHGAPGDRSLLTHTADLARAAEGGP